MGKNKKSTIKYKNIDVDSKEEWEFFCWLDEAKDLGIVLDYEYQPKEFNLTDKHNFIPAFNNPNHKEKLLVREHIYTADFHIKFNIKYGEKLSKAFKIATSDIQDNVINIWIDVKGAFNKFGGDRLLPIHQKLVFERYGIYIQKLVPKEFFKICGVPLSALRTPKGNQSKIYTIGNFNLIKTEFNV